RRIGAAAAFLAGAALACGWLFLGNAILYGDPLENLTLHRRVDPPMEAVPPPAWWKDIFTPILSLSVFGVFGWAPVVPGVVETALFGVLLAAAAAGWTRRGNGTRDAWLPAALSLLGLATEVAVNTHIHQPQGRHLFFVLGAIAPTLVGGWCALHPARPARAAAAALGALGLLHVALFAGRLLPAFHPLNARDDPYRSFTNASDRRLREAVSIEVEGPENGSAVREAPALRWSTSTGARYEVQLSVGEAEFARPEWRLDRVVRRTYGHLGRTQNGSFEFPADAWSALPPGVPLYWRVVRLVRVSEVEEGSGVLETSGTRRVFRSAP
ncbi:MAG: hypothetical protein L0323_23805, partial [Planctomycetes bacterium]|nr:hypothetical protein [Planctomycetota bacterium]